MRCVPLIFTTMIHIRIIFVSCKGRKLQSFIVTDGLRPKKEIENGQELIQFHLDWV